MHAISRVPAIIREPHAQFARGPHAPHHSPLTTHSLRSGDILAFHSSDTFFGRLIRLATGGPSHVAIVCERGGDLLAWHASKDESTPCARCGETTDGVHAIDVETILRDAGRVYRLPIRRPLESHQIARLLGFLSQRDGQQYDTSRALAAGRFTRWLWPSRSNYRNWFCSELVVAALVECGAIHPYTVRSPAAWQPRDVIDRLVSLGIYGLEEMIR